jgi:hypothetical protein
MDHETIKNDAACQDKRFIYGSYMTEVSPFLRKFSDHPNYQSLKKLLVGTKNEIQFLCQYLLLFQ